MAGNSTDTRIVQMQFDNRDFEKNIAQSNKSLDKFKEALDFEQCTESLDEFESATKRLTFDSMSENLQKLTDKFTGLGTMSELVISQIRRGIEQTAAKVSSFIDSMTTAQIWAGQSKYDMLNKSVQTIKAATDMDEAEVYRVLERLNKYTDQTSYNFADMAQNIGKFTSVGIPLEYAEQQMEGIANWAARSGAGIMEASRAMYNLSQAMGVGKLQLVDWKSIENAGMATKEFKEQLIDAAVAAGTLVKETDKKTGKEVVRTAKNLGKQVEVNFQNVGATLNKGWATKDVLGATLQRYYWDDLYYESSSALLALDDAKKEIFDKMFADDKKLGQEEWDTLVGMGVMTDEIKSKILDLAASQGKLTKEIGEDGKAIYKVVDKQGKKVVVTLDTIGKSLDTGWFDQTFADSVTGLNDLAKSSYEAAQKCLTFNDVIGAWKDQLSTGWMNTFKHIFGELSESMELFSNICNKVSYALDELVSFRNRVLEAWGSAGGRNSLWSLIVGEVTDPETGEAIAYKNAYGLLDVLGTVGEMVKTAFWDIMKIFAGTDATLNWEDEGYKEGWMAARIQAMLDAVHNFIQGVRDFFNAIPDGSDKSRFQQIQDVVTAMFATAVLAYTAIRDIIGFVDGVRTQLQPSIDALLRLLSALGLGVYDLAKSSEEGQGLKLLFDELLTSIQPLTSAINGLVEQITGMLITFIQTGKEKGTFTKFWNAVVKVIGALANIISRVGAPVLDFIASLMDAVGDLFEKGFTSENLKDLGGKIEKAITQLFDDLFGLIPGIGGKIQGWIAYLFGFAEEGAVGEANENSRTILGVLKQWLGKIFGGLANFIGMFTGEMKDVSLFSIIKEGMGLGLLGKFITGFGRLLQSTNLYQLLTMFGSLFLVFKGIKFFREGIGIFKNVRGFMEGLNKTLKDGIKFNLDQDAETLGDKVWSIAISIAAVAAAVAVLGSMSPGALAKGLLALTATVGVLFGFLLLLKNFVVKDFKESISMIGTIGSIAVAIFGMLIGFTMLIAALRPLGKMKPEEIMGMLTGLFGIVTIMGLFAKFVGTVALKGTRSLAGLALGLGLLLLALRPLASMNMGELGMMEAGLIGVLGILAIFSSQMKTMHIKGTGSLIALAASVAILVFSLLPLAQMNAGQLGMMEAGLIGILGVLALFTKKVAFMKGSGMLNLVAVAGSVWILVQAVLPLADLGVKQLAKVGAAIAGIMFVLGVFINNTQSMKWTGMMEMVALAGAIWILVQAIQPLANYEWPQLAKMGVGLVLMTGIVIGFSHLTKQMNLIKGGGTAILLVGLAAVIGAFGLAMAATKDTPWQNIVTACLGLIAVLAVFAQIQKSLLSEADIFQAVHTLVAMIGLGAIIIAFSIGLNEIRNVPVEKILAFSVGLAAMLAAFGYAMSLVKNISVGAAIKGIGIIAVGVAALMGVLALMAPLVVGSIGSSIEKMSAKLSLAAGMFQNFAGKMRDISEEEIASARRKFDALMDLIRSLQDVSSFLPGISMFSGAMLSLGSALWQFNFSTREIPAADTMPGIALMNTLLEKKEDLANFSIGNAAEEIFGLGVGLMLFQEATKDITTAEPMAFRLLQGLAGEADNLTKLTSLPLDTFKAQIAGLGGALAIYAMGAKEATGLEIDQETDISGALTLLQKVTEGLGGENGFELPNLPTENELDGFGAELAALATAIIKFNDASQDLGDTSKAIAVLGFMRQLKLDLTENNLAVAKEFGNAGLSWVSLTTFGLELAALGTALSNYDASTKNFTGSKAAYDALDFFADLKERLTNDKLTTITIFKNNHISQDTLTEFGTQIGELGNALSGFATNVNFGSEQEQKFKDGIAALDDIVEIGRKLPVVGGVAGLIKGNMQTIGDMADDIESIGQSLGDFSNSLSGTEGLGTFNTKLVSDAVGIIQAFADIATTMGTLDAARSNGYDTSIIFGAYEYITALDNLFYYLNTNRSEGGRTLAEEVVTFMHSFELAMQAIGGFQDITIFEAFRNMAAAVSELVNIDPSLDFTKVGENISKGVKTGIENGQSAVVNAVIAMVRAAIEAGNQTAEIESPSRVFARMGGYLAQGMAKGIHDEAYSAEQETVGMVNNLVNNADSALDNLSVLLTQGIDTNPTIRPVLDLSNIEAGVPLLNSMLGGGYGVGLDASLSASRASRYLPEDGSVTLDQNGVKLDGITSRIDILNQQIDTLGARIANMKLVLNTGVVAGGVTDQVDLNLGRKQIYAERRN